MLPRHPACPWRRRSRRRNLRLLVVRTTSLKVGQAATGCLLGRSPPSRPPRRNGVPIAHASLRVQPGSGVEMKRVAVVLTAVITACAFLVACGDDKKTL